MKREQFATRIGFLLTTAGCAIGLGNVWRFPYIAGNYGGAIFVLIYLVFLAILGFPVMVAELALGRAAQSDLPGAYKVLNKGKFRKFWPAVGHLCFVGNFVLLMFYSVVTGWMLAYCWKYIGGDIQSCTDSGKYFGGFLQNWKEQLAFTLIGIAVTTAVCMGGVRKGIEKTLKVMLGGLFLLELIMIVLVLRFDGAMNGLKFFFEPSMEKLNAVGFWPAAHAAMMQAFFTLSLGIGSIAICGSYIGKERSLSGESILVIVLDTIAAIGAGMIIFPACFAFGVKPDQGPSLLFVTLTNIFRSMPGGRVMGILFFLFMSVAALSTLIAVGENIIAYLMRVLNLSRVKASALFGVILSVISLPCLFGFNLWSGFQPMGKGTCVLDLEDFIISDNILPLGTVFILIFCTRKIGWGMDNFIKEVNTGKGIPFPRILHWYVKWILPIGIFAIWAHNIITKLILK